jgi:hypothetical protein
MCLPLPYRPRRDNPHTTLTESKGGRPPFIAFTKRYLLIG